MKHVRNKHTFFGFSLLELLVIAAIIAVLASFAIPGYINSITQSRVNALWQQAEAAKLAVESEYLKRNTDIADITVNSGDAEYTTSMTDFVKCITIQNGVVSVVGKSEDFNDLSIWIAWQPTVSADSITWTCSYSTDAAPYVTDTSDTCAVDSCVEYGSWETATVVDSQTFWYFGALSQAQVSTAFAQNCETSGAMSGCGSCYNFVNTPTQQRFMDFDLSTTTYDYQGALGSDPTWSSYSSWSYQYTYTVVTQSCMEQTRSSSSCTSTSSFANDSACN